MQETRPSFAHVRLVLRSAVQIMPGSKTTLFPGVRRRTIVRGNVSEVRASVAAKLVEALGEVEALAKKSGKRARKGTGGIPAKARWYQIMASIAQTLDHVLRSEDLDAIRDKMLEMEKTIDELQRTTPQTG